MNLRISDEMTDYIISEKVRSYMKNIERISKDDENVEDENNEN